MTTKKTTIPPPPATAGSDSQSPPSPSPAQPAQTGQGSGIPAGIHAMRRAGTRHEVTERVTLKGDGGAVLEGWALNVSRGGLRAILEEKVVLGQKFDVGVGSDDEALHRVGRVVWVQEEPDGVIVGLEFSGMSGTHKSVPPPAADD